MTLLDEKRLEINDIDTQLVQLFEQRMHAVESIIQYKLANQLPILDIGREEQNILRTKVLLQDACLIILNLGIAIPCKFQKTIRKKSKRNTIRNNLYYMHA